ncbi:YqhR family membrane protein [Chengkuizengella axinellae]|uniref:YqhR family membrane protein n=1 Tax=Chengkuizengella axinellae TaxID=3064388 RepID=A0ABT9J2G4_9BACL|nr:YqhR family membrane protein [Chengkuizengella sp. 2205SS18-9]MDP5275683.1 YqhR family membrane protein [Chengkuizengella sp. 2205SS18-9]
MNDDKQNKKRTNRFTFALNLGFFAGFIWGLVHQAFYYLTFTKISSSFLAEPFFKHKFIDSWPGFFTGLLFFILFSIICAFIYTLLFSKVKGAWLGIVYGLFWWANLYLWIGPMTGMMKWINNMDINSIISGVCLFILWGIFIGYTVAIEFTNEQAREPYKN